MPMKRFSILLLILMLPLWACRQAEDTRYFAPELCFEAADYSVQASEGGADVVITLSRPATVDFTIDLVITSELQEGVQYTVPSHSLSVAKGATEARLHITLVDDEIWDESSSIDILLTPGERYTIDPAKACATRVTISKHVVIPVLRLSIPEAQQEVNPYLAPTVMLILEADKAPIADVEVVFTADGLAPGTGFLIDGEARSTVVLPANSTEESYALQILKIDQSGYDGNLTLSMSAQKGKYGVGTEGASVSVHLSDPAVNFKPLWKTAAQVGEGYQFRQAILAGDGETWSGNLAANMTVSSEGSSYLKNLRNMGSSTFNCMSNEVGLHILRLAEFFPTLRTTSGDAIVDYGNNSNTRGFSPVDSLFRFVLDPGSSTEGSLMLNSPRTFTAFVGDYTSWQANWQKDSKATGGDIFASTSPIITGRLDVMLVKLEGRFNLSDASNTLLFTAWFSCDSPQFMDGVDFDTLGAEQDGDLWKVNYKIWPR